MVDHIVLQMEEMQRSAAFYDAVLEPLGGTRMMDFGVTMGYGADKPTFWITKAQSEGRPREVHVAFAAANRAQVVAFRDAAAALGAEILHEPREWPEYHPGYFGAFVRDPDGNNVEAVCHTPE